LNVSRHVEKDVELNPKIPFASRFSKQPISQEQ